MIEEKITEKMKKNINVKYLKEFSLNDLNKYKFIPVNELNNHLVVGIQKTNDINNVNIILTKIATKTNLKPKIVSLSQLQFDYLFNYSKKLLEMNNKNSK